MKVVLGQPKSSSSRSVHAHLAIVRGMVTLNKIFY